MAQGRSLREFDLQTRLFRYRLSYMIYSDLFDALPRPIRDRVYRDSHDVLTGTDRQRTVYERALRRGSEGRPRHRRRHKTRAPSYWTPAN